MRTRDAVLLYEETQGADSGTKTINLDIVDPVTALYIEAIAINGTTSNEDNFISDVLKRIEIVDGSEVLASLTMHELEALHFYKLKDAPILFPSEWGSGVQRHGAYLLFGRFLYDPMFGMVFTKYKNPQLKLTWDLAAVRPVSATTAFATGTTKLSVVAKIMENAGMPTQYLMDKEIIGAYTSSSSSGAEERKELPTDNVYRMIMTRHYAEGYDPNEITSDLKLTADADKYIGFNRKITQLDSEALMRFGLINIQHDVYRATGGVIRGLLQKETYWHLVPNTSTQFTDFVYSLMFSGNVTLETQIPGGGSAGTRLFRAREIGHSLHGTIPLPFGDLNNPDSWFDPKGFRKLELILTSGGNAGTCQIVAEQVKALP